MRRPGCRGRGEWLVTHRAGRSAAAGVGLQSGARSRLGQGQRPSCSVSGHHSVVSRRSVGGLVPGGGRTGAERRLCVNC